MHPLSTFLISATFVLGHSTLEIYVEAHFGSAGFAISNMISTRARY